MWVTVVWLFFELLIVFDLFSRCCDSIPAPSSQDEEAEGVGLYRGSEPSCQANGDLGDFSESYSSGVASEPNKSHRVDSEPNKSHGVASEPNKSHGNASEPNQSHGVPLHHNFFVNGWMYPNELGQLCGPYMQQQLYEGLKSGFLPHELMVHPVLNGSIMNSVPLKYFTLYPEHVATGFTYLNAAGSALMPGLRAASAPRSEPPLHGFKSLISHVGSQHPPAHTSSSKLREPNSGAAFLPQVLNLYLLFA